MRMTFERRAAAALLTLSLTLFAACERGVIEPAVDVSAVIEMDARGCLQKICPDGAPRCDDAVKTCVLDVEVARGDTLGWLASQDFPFQIILTPAQPADPEDFGVRSEFLVVNERAALGYYKYTVVAKDPGRCPFDNNICDPRIKVIPERVRPRPER